MVVVDEVVAVVAEEDEGSRLTMNGLLSETEQRDQGSSRCILSRMPSYSDCDFLVHDCIFAIIIFTFLCILKSNVISLSLCRWHFL